MQASGPKFGLEILYPVGHSSKWMSPFCKLALFTGGSLGPYLIACCAYVPLWMLPWVLATNWVPLAHSAFDFCDEGNKHSHWPTWDVFVTMSRCQALHPQSWEGMDSKNSQGNPRGDTRPCPCCSRNEKEPLYTHHPVIKGIIASTCQGKRQQAFRLKASPQSWKEIRVGLELPSSHENTKLKLTVKQPSTKKIWTYQEDILYSKRKKQHRMAGGCFWDVPNSYLMVDDPQTGKLSS